MNTKLIAVAVLAGLAATSASRASFEDYYFIPGSAIGSSGIGQINNGGTSFLSLGSYPAPKYPLQNSGIWTFRSYQPGSPAIGARAQFQRMPSTPEDAPALGFSITAQANALMGFSINAPWNPDPLVSDQAMNCPSYTFTWNVYELNRPGVKAYWIDADGHHDMLTSTGAGVFNSTQKPTSPDVFGFYIETPGASAQVPIGLNIQGWQCVPEPSSVAMGVLTSLGAIGYGYRRYRNNKS